jgi:hypothetical protein
MPDILNNVGQSPIKVGTFGIMNNPEYRQEPWRESIAQRLACFDSVCLVCGNEPDLAMLAQAFPEEWRSGKLKAVYKPWPFPEWSYEELPKHLNASLMLAREQSCKWMVRLDIDTTVHEKDMKYLRRAIAKADRKGKWLVSMRKLQFFKPTRYFKKAYLPLAVDVTKPIAYGFDRLHENDLCQPIEWDGVSTVVQNGKAYDIPSGIGVPENKILKSRRARLFNYDFTFRTDTRSIELLYQIEMAHARFWNKGYEGRTIEKISKESSMEDFLKLSAGRYARMKKQMPIVKHPKHFQASLENLKPGQWGYDFWGKLVDGK